MKSIGRVLKEKQLGEKPVFARHEFQAFGLYLAQQLGDLERKALYIKLAKEERRSLLEKCLQFVKERSPRSKARLFMWRLKQLREDA